MTGPIVEVSCAVARVGRRVYLVLRLEDVAGRAPEAMAPLGGGATLILLAPGDAVLDFVWLGGGGAVGEDPEGEMRAGVAAAVAARLGGAVLPERSLLGGRIGSPHRFRFSPARPDWWRGTWMVRAAEGEDAAPGCPLGPPGLGRGFVAELILHGEIVLP